MNEGLIPKRYAKALFKFACEQKGADRIYELTSNLCGSFVGNVQLEPTIANPFVGGEEKVRLLVTAAGAKPTDSVYLDFLKLLRQNNRLPITRAAALAYREIYREANNIYLVDVVAAHPLDAPEEERLKRLIASHLNGGTMEYTFSVDPDLIGGFTISIDNERLDASIKNELKQLRLKLLSK